jgi:hypothetical protein
VYFKLCSTCRAVCWDGVTREFEHNGFFASRDLLDHWLAVWTDRGFDGKYTYFTTPAQKLANETAALVHDEDIPALSICWWGKSQHHHTFVEKS